MTSPRGEERRRAGAAPGLPDPDPRPPRHPAAAHAPPRSGPPPCALRAPAGCARASPPAPPGAGPPPQGPDDLQQATARRPGGLYGPPNPRAARALNGWRLAGPKRSPLGRERPARLFSLSCPFCFLLPSLEDLGSFPCILNS